MDLNSFVLGFVVGCIVPVIVTHIIIVKQAADAQERLEEREKILDKLIGQLKGDHDVKGPS